MTRMRLQPSTCLPPLQALAHRVEQVLTGLSPSHNDTEQEGGGEGGEKEDDDVGLIASNNIVVIVTSELTN